MTYLTSTGCIFLVVSDRCGRRWRNYVSIRGKIETFSVVSPFWLFHFRQGKSTVILFGLQNGLNMNGNYDFEGCIGLKVRPRKGDGLLFYSLFPNGTIDPVSVSSEQPQFQIYLEIMLKIQGVSYVGLLYALFFYSH